MEDVFEYFDSLYPDKMVVEKMGEHERLMLAGKVDLIREMKRFVNEEYGTKLGKAKQHKN